MELARLLDSLRRAVEAQPDDDVLRAHLASLLVQAARGQEAVGHLGRLLAGDPGNVEYQELMRAAMGVADLGLQG
jgi:thioredoxin-like negative regulator of GroEL